MSYGDRGVMWRGRLVGLERVLNMEKSWNAAEGRGPCLRGAKIYSRLQETRSYLRGVSSGETFNMPGVWGPEYGH